MIWPSIRKTCPWTELTLLDSYPPGKDIGRDLQFQSVSDIINNSGAYQGIHLFLWYAQMGRPLRADCIIA
jgi:hypothetical protein